jgi:hypothetical protein
MPTTLLLQSCLDQGSITKSCFEKAASPTVPGGADDSLENQTNICTSPSITIKAQAAATAAAGQHKATWPLSLCTCTQQ